MSAKNIFFLRKFPLLKHSSLLTITAFFLVLIIVADVVVLFAIFQKRQIELDQTKEQTIKKESQSILAQCTQKDHWSNCYSDMFSRLAKEYDLNFTLEILEAINKKDQRLTDCHVIAHKIMTEEVEKHPDKWQQLLKIVDPNICNYGFIHGIIEGKMRVDPTFTLNPKTIPSFCEAMLTEKGSRGVDQTCAHIVGHVILVQTHADIVEAVKICQSIPVYLQKECASGIFMENFTRENLVAHGIAEFVPWDDQTIAEIENICRQYDGNIAYGCWQEISHLYNHRARLTPYLVLQDCKHAPSETLQKACFLHAVATFIQNPSFDISDFASVCTVFSDNSFVGQCMSTAVKSLLNSSIEPRKAAISFCLAQKKRKNECFYMIHDFLSMKLKKREIQSYCSNVPKNYRPYCLGDKRTR
jgi:hypothetical protein